MFGHVDQVEFQIGNELDPRLLGDHFHEPPVGPIGAGIVEIGCHGGDHRELVVLHVEQQPVPPHLFPHFTESVFGPRLVRLVYDHQVGEVEHVDLLQLGRRAVFRSHHVHRHVGHVHDLGVALADPRRLQHDQVETRRLQDLDRRGDGGRQRHVGSSGRHRPHVHPGMGHRVHPDPVSQQRTSGAATGGVDRQDRHVGVFEVQHEAPQQLVDQRRFPGPAGAGDAHNGNRPPTSPHRDLVEQVGVFVGVVLGRRDEPGHQPMVGRVERVEEAGRVVEFSQWEIRAGQHVVDHSLQPHRPAVVGCVDPGDPLRHELLRLGGEDGSSPTTEDPNVSAVALGEHVPEVTEELHVPPLVGGDRHRLDVLFHRGLDDLTHRAVVTEVDHLGARSLQDPPEDVDRGVVTVEEGGGGDEPYPVDGAVGHGPMLSEALATHRRTAKLPSRGGRET